MTNLDLSTLSNAEIAQFTELFPDAAAWLRARFDAMEHARLASTAHRTRYQEQRYQALGAALQRSGTAGEVSP